MSPKRAKTGVFYQSGQRRSRHHNFTPVKVLTLKLSETSTLIKKITHYIEYSKDNCNHNVERLATIKLLIVLDNHYIEKVTVKE